MSVLYLAVLSQHAFKSSNCLSVSKRGREVWGSKSKCLPLPMTTKGQRTNQEHMGNLGCVDCQASRCPLPLMSNSREQDRERCFRRI
eukprot:1161000-Pelagomonas_calceolata.AAC.13